MTGIEASASLFAPAAIDEETLALNNKLREIERDSPARWEVALEVERRMEGAGGGGLLPATQRNPAATERLIRGAGGELALRQILPSEGRQPQGIYVYLHGGGFAFGAADRQDGMLTAIADRARVAVVSVEYRRAPENPYPAAVTDAEVAAWWAVRNGKAEFGSERILLGGDSAGAYLAALAALRLRDRHAYAGLAGLNLCQGCYDLSGTPSMRAGDDALVISRRSVDMHMSRFLPGMSAEERRNPEVSPLFADLSRLPPALFTAGTFDPLLDDNLFMHARWIAAGNRAELALYPGGFHGFTLFPTGLARRAAARIEAFIAETGLR
jgi:acetyl esterase/lipase